MERSIEAYQAWFEDYVDSYMRRVPDGAQYIALKRDHTKRVLENAICIADSLQLTRDVCRITLLGALLHDVGRFKQYELYRTFSDRNSVNHGLLGCRILRQENVLHDEPAHIRNAVRATVALHNRLVIPEHINDPLMTALNVVRDSDKLDIFPVLVSNFVSDGSANDVVVMNLKDDPNAYTSSMLHAFKNGQSLRYADMRYVNDFKLLLASWVFAMNFPATIALMKERGVMDGLLDTLPPLPEMEQVKHMVHDEISRVLRGEKAE